MLHEPEFRVIGVKFNQGKRSLVRVSGEFDHELSEFDWGGEIQGKWDLVRVSGGSSSYPSSTYRGSTALKLPRKQHLCQSLRAQYFQSLERSSGFDLNESQMPKKLAKTKTKKFVKV